MRVLVLAPFERGRGHGGSQRATAIAERLEDRGFEVGWQVVPPRATGPVDKLLSLARGEPALAGLYELPGELLPGPWDAALIAHSYLLPRLSRALARIPAIVDFHNLEWVHLADGARLERRQRRLPGARDAYTRSQVALMRRLERLLIRRAPLSLLVSDSDVAWARSVAPTSRLALVPSLLPEAEERTAARIHAARAPEPGHLVYLGTLAFPPNLMSLRRFLVDEWPSMRDAEPGLQLTVVGACAPSDQIDLARHPGVRPIGFVEDVTPILSRCSAVVMPIDGVAGTSLRAVFYALAGLPVIGTPNAFRGLPFHGGIEANSSEDWIRAARESMRTEASWSASMHDVREAALLHQHERAPWDHLVGLIDEAIGSDRRVTARAPVSG
jgi:Glycosyl transferases group 1